MKLFRDPEGSLCVGINTDVAYHSFSKSSPSKYTQPASLVKPYFNRPQWYTEQLPYLPFIVPSTSHFGGPLLGRLQESDLGFPIETDGTVWQLEQNHIDSWARLEKGLIAMINTLHASEGTLFTMNMVQPAHPNQFGYKRSYNS